MLKRLAIALLSGIVAGAGLLISGCETESASSPIRISPSSVSIEKNQTVRFTVSGGYDHTWSLETDDWGMLSTRTGSATAYTSLYDPGTDTNTGPKTALQILTVVSTIQGTSSQSGTNTVPYQATAEAYVYHIGIDTRAEEDEAPIITPSEVTLTEGESVTLQAHGGDHCSWSLQHEEWGTLTTRTGPITKYTSLHAPDAGTVDVQTVTATCAQGTAEAKIKHIAPE